MVSSTIEPGPPFLNHKLKYKIRWRLGRSMFLLYCKKCDDYVTIEDTYVPLTNYIVMSYA